MKLSRLNVIPTSRDAVDVFGGYNHNLRIGDGEFYDMKNLTSSNYPALSPRKKRGTYVKATSPQGLIAKDALCYVDGSKFVINEYPIEMGLNDELKQLVSMGAYVIIMPDKKYINTLDYTDMGDIEAEFTTTDDITFTLCTLDGADYENVSYHTPPAEPKNMDLWLDTSSTPSSLKQYSENSESWVTIPTTYVKISSPGIGAKFKQYDGVTISGIVADDLVGFNSTSVLWATGEDYIVIIGIINGPETQLHEASPVTISRKMPNMDFIIESENRLWGCRYGTSVNGAVVNEIYACKLGDFKNWNCFMQISTDSYVASCGTDGQFTGAITHLGYPLFFKENCVHKVYGNYPANFQIQTTACRGVQKGCSDSLAIVNEVLYYKSRNAVCAYDGSLPVEMSTPLGDIAYSDAVACSHGNKYYISMKDNAMGHSHLFVYDTYKRLWHKEDDLSVKKFCSCRNELYYIPHNSTDIKTMFGSGTVDEEPVKWMAETGILGMYTPDKKYISRLNIRMSLDVNTKVQIYIQYDSCGEWELVSSMTSTNIRSFSIPIRPRRCDHFRIKFEGEGNGNIFSISKTLEQGSDI